jgi:hypothetical protein
VIKINVKKIGTRPRVHWPERELPQMFHSCRYLKTEEYSIFEFQEVVPDRIQMSEWTRTDWRVGMWSAMGAATIGVIFVVLGLIGVVAPTAKP